VRSLLILFILLAAGTAAPGSGAAAPAYPVMRPDTATVLRWQEEAAKAPRARIDPNLRRKILADMAQGYGASLSLLARLSYVPAERTQGACGNCWNWAGQAVAGIALDVQGVAHQRLSVQFLDSCKLDDYACCGGWLQMFADWYREKGYFLPWSAAGADFADSQSICADGRSSRTCEQIDTSTRFPVHRVAAVTIDTTAISRAEAIANIKNVLLQNRAVWFGYFLPDQETWSRFFEFWSGSGESAVVHLDTACGRNWEENGGGGHAVAIVGYDDSGDTPYWLVLNSWGTAGGRRPGWPRRPASR